MKNLEDKTKNLKLNTFLLALVAGLIWVKLAFIYFQFRVNNYIAPPGDDPANHLEKVANLLAGKVSFSYPFLFHYLVGKASIFSQIDLMEAFVKFTPVLIVLPAIAIFVFAWMNFGRLAAIVAFTIALFASNYPILAYADGNYPNILSAGFFMIISLSFLSKVIARGGWANYLMFCLFAILTAMSHHLSIFYLSSIILGLLIFFGIRHFLYRDVKNYKPLLFFIVTMVAVFLLLVLTTSLREPFFAFVSSLKASKAALQESNYFTKLLDFSDYGSLAGELVLNGGLFAMLYIISCLFSKKYNKEVKISLIFLAIWFLAIFIFSRFSFVLLPGRFARELAPPLAIAIGFFIADISRIIESRNKKLIYFGIVVIIVWVNLSQVNAGSYRSPEFFNKMIRFAITDKTDSSQITLYTPEKSLIISNPTTPYLPFASSRNIVFIKASDTAGSQQLARAIKYYEATHVFVGTSSWPKPDPVAYPFFKDYEEISDGMERIMNNSTCSFEEFSTGSKLYQITKKCLSDLTK